MKILLVEDEPTLRAQLRASLIGAGYAVDAADNGVDAEFMGATESYDAVVLDLGLPGLDGMSVLRNWRRAHHTMPVIVLTARGSWSERVAGIDAGADDYLTKPFHVEELHARLRGLIRRAHGRASPVLQCGDVMLDTRTGRVVAGGVPVSLTSHEHRVLDYLLHRLGELVSRAELVESLYAQGSDRDSNTVEVFVGRLRRKIPSLPLETVRGMGYRLGPPNAGP